MFTYRITGSSFQACWEELTSKYSNKRVLIQEQLHKLLNQQSIKHRSASTLTGLITSAVTIKKTLKALDAAKDMENCLLVYQVASCLDKVTREAWETLVGSSTDFPPFEQLEAFIKSKVTALERMEAEDQASSSKKPFTSPTNLNRSTARKTTAHASTQPASHSPAGPHSTASTRYSCDYCKGEHYIPYLSPVQRSVGRSSPQSSQQAHPLPQLLWQT